MLLVWIYCLHSTGCSDKLHNSPRPSFSFHTTRLSAFLSTLQHHESTDVRRTHGLGISGLWSSRPYQSLYSRCPELKRFRYVSLEHEEQTSMTRGGGHFLRPTQNKNNTLRRLVLTISRRIWLTCKGVRQTKPLCESLQPIQTSTAATSDFPVYTTDFD